MLAHSTSLKTIHGNFGWPIRSPVTKFLLKLVRLITQLPLSVSSGGSRNLLWGGGWFSTPGAPQPGMVPRCWRWWWKIVTSEASQNTNLAFSLFLTSGNMNFDIAHASLLFLHTFLITIIKNNAAESNLIATLQTIHARASRISLSGASANRQRAAVQLMTCSSVRCHTGSKLTFTWNFSTALRKGGILLVVVTGATNFHPHEGGGRPPLGSATVCILLSVHCCPSLRNVVQLLSISIFIG